jgi:bifunctional pyridoxal-dependent enzyme with beta-cystathionase and maltose regulon repressor activities
MRPSQSGILSWIDISELGTAGEVAAHLRDHAAVIVNEGDAYGPGGEGHLRIVHGALSERARFEAVARRMREALLALGNHRESRTRVAGGGRDGE